MNEANQFGIEPSIAHATSPFEMIVPTMVNWFTRLQNSIICFFYIFFFFHFKCIEFRCEKFTFMAF